jgi:2-polyprenyl-6-methoxyphenol hydroxylase-like FAD-dependent oxidoreductase
MPGETSEDAAAVFGYSGRPMRRKLEIAIAGAGIGGLTAALALRARGLDVTVFEQTSAFREIGAGIALGANAVLLLERIGLENSLRVIGSPNKGLTLLTRHGAPIAGSPAARKTTAARPDQQLHRPQGRICETADRGTTGRNSPLRLSMRQGR